MTQAAEWSRYYADIGLKKSIADKYSRYVTQMASQGLPPIFEFDHLAKLLGRRNEYLASVVNSPDSHYRTFMIQKRSGGLRQIDAPYPALLECQQWLTNQILSKLPVHNAAHGFRKNRSILTNASVHLGCRQLLKMDLQDFFPSIPQRRVTGIFRHLGYPQNVSFFLSSLCCFDKKLPQGGATSPAISNLVARRLDARLSGLARAWKLKYTRYADDLAFSGKFVPANFVNGAKEVIAAEGFWARDNKTHLIRNSKKIVTGIVVDGDSLRLSRDYKRAVRQDTHFVLKHGLYSHLAKRRITDPFYIDRLHGRLQ